MNQHINNMSLDKNINPIIPNLLISFQGNLDPMFIQNVFGIYLTDIITHNVYNLYISEILNVIQMFLPA